MYQAEVWQCQKATIWNIDSEHNARSSCQGATVLLTNTDAEQWTSPSSTFKVIWKHICMSQLGQCTLMGWREAGQEVRGLHCGRHIPTFLHTIFLVCFPPRFSVYRPVNPPTHCELKRGEASEREREEAKRNQTERMRRTETERKSKGQGARRREWEGGRRR